MVSALGLGGGILFIVLVGKLLASFNICCLIVKLPLCSKPAPMLPLKFHGELKESPLAWLVPPIFGPPIMPPPNGGGGVLKLLNPAPPGGGIMLLPPGPFHQLAVALPSNPEDCRWLYVAEPMFMGV